MKQSFSQFFQKNRPAWLLFILAILLFALLVCALESQFPLLADLTENHLFSISDATKELLQNLTKSVSIYSFYSPGNEDPYTYPLLRQYALASDKINFNSIDPATASSLLNQFNLSLDQAANAIVITTPDYTRFRVLQQNDLYATDADLHNISRAESKISSAIKYISTGSSARIRIMQGHGETSLSDLSLFVSGMNDLNYEISTFTYPDDSALNAASDLLIISSPKQDITQAEYLQIKQFIASGGSALVCMNTSSFDWNTGKLTTIPGNFPNFSRLLAELGMQIQPNIIACQDASAFSLRPSTILLTGADHSITQFLESTNLSVVFSEAASIDLLSEEVTPLLYTSENCYARRFSDAIPNLKYEEDALQSFIVGALWQKEDSRVIVYSSSILPNSQISISGNQTLVVNSVDFLIEQDGLRIPSKTIGQEHIHFSSRLTQLFLGIIIVCLLPLCLLGIGLFLFHHRKTR